MIKSQQAVLADQNIIHLINTMSNEETTEVVRTLVNKFNPAPLGILRVEKLFQKHVEFDSKDELIRKLGRNIKPSVLNAVLVKLVVENKIMINDDESLTWIYVVNNEKLKQSWKKARPLKSSKDLDK